MARKQTTQPRKESVVDARGEVEEIVTRKGAFEL